MATCGLCKRSDLHEEYLDLQGLGYRPVLHEPDGTRHRCLKPWQDTRPIAMAQPKPTPKPQPAPPTSHRRTVETSQ